MKIYCDGSCLGNPGSGGWAFVMLQNEKTSVFQGNAANTTNNKMELVAAIKGLEEIKNIKYNGKIDIFCDSKYVINGIQSWIRSWKKNNWQGSNKKPVKNIDLWKRLDVLDNELDITWNWVKAHNGNKYNEMADKYAKEAATLKLEK